MIKLDDNLLQELGLSALPAEDKKKMLAHIYETLEMRVGMELAKQMTDAHREYINSLLDDLYGRYVTAIARCGSSKTMRARPFSSGVIVAGAAV